MRRGLGIFQFFTRPKRVSVNDVEHIYTVIEHHIFDHIIVRTVDSTDLNRAHDTDGSHIQDRRDPPSHFIRPDDGECGQRSG